MALITANSYTVGEGRNVAKGLARMLTHTARRTMRREDHILTANDLRAFAIGALVGQPVQNQLTPARVQALNDLVGRIVRLTFAEAAEAGISSPPTRPLERALTAATRREASFAGAEAFSVIY